MMINQMFLVGKLRVDIIFPQEDDISKCWLMENMFFVSAGEVVPTRGYFWPVRSDLELSICGKLCF